MPTLTELPFQRHDLIEIAMALTEAAVTAHGDDRLDTAARRFHHAARFYDAAGYECTANDKRRLAHAAETEAAVARVAVIEHITSVANTINVGAA
jgi:hypothetical protein